MSRAAQIERNTKETEVYVSLELDGSGKSEISTGIGFFDHMLEGFARHGLFDLTVKVKGDLSVDDHHTIEDTGIVLGRAIAEALGGKQGIRRYGQRILPMDEVLTLCALDLGGRAYFSYEAPFTPGMMGQMNTEMVREFFCAVAFHAMMNLHIRVLTAGNNHHMAESIFKAFAKALDEAVSVDERISGIMTTKGMI